MVYGGLPSRFDALKKKLSQGCVFDKFGRLRPGHTDESKRATLDFFAEVSGLIESSTGLPVFPFYGNLLGAIREQDFIAHDVGGFDIVVICRSAGPARVKAEFAEICCVLLEHGYHLKLEPWGVLIRRKLADTRLLDLSYGWFNADDELNVSFGWRFTPVRGRDSLTAHRMSRLADRAVRVPGNAEDLLEQLYGPRWEVPDQGYRARHDLRREGSYLLTKAEMQALLDRNPAQVELQNGG
jgi:hypothetical protein